MSVEGTSTEKEMEVTNEISVPTQDDLLKEVERLRQSKERLLAESKAYKSKYQEMRSAVDKAEEDRLNASNDLTGLLELEKKKKEEAEEKYEKLRKDNYRKSLIVEVSKHAKDAHDVNDIFSNLNSDLVKYNEETNSFDGVKENIEQLRSNKSYLFGSNEIPGQASGRPSPEKQKTFEEIIKDDPKHALESVLGDFLK